MTTKLDDSGVMFADGTVMGSAKQLGMRNKLINGNFSINQRAVSGTVVLAAGAYGHDRFKAGASGCTYTFATSNNVTTITISAGSLQQVVEGLNLQSGTHVLSWAGTSQGRIDGGAYGASGAVTATATGGTNMTVEFNTGTLSLAQLEEGSLSSRFEQRLVTVELALCQRYYWKLLSDVRIWGYNTANGEVNQYIGFPVTMRATPTVTTTTGGAYAAIFSVQSISASGFTAQAAATAGGGFFITYSAGNTASVEL